MLRRFSMVLSAVLVCAPLARGAAYTATILHPLNVILPTLGQQPGYGGPINGQAVTGFASVEEYLPGNSYAGYYQHAFFWDNGSSTGVDLNPSAYYQSTTYSISGNQEVGSASGPTTSNNQNAMIWSGTAASAINIHPAGFINSIAHGTDGTNQVGAGGLVSGSSNTHALLWSGTAASAVDLHPSGFTSSEALAVAGNQQVGDGIPSSSSYAHALVWSGTAASAVDLNPAGFVESSALGTNGTQQVGAGETAANPSNGQALLWNGTAASAVNLNPAGFTFSYAYGTNGVEQVGTGEPLNSSGEDALVWKGTASSAIDLGALLPDPANYVISQAFQIDSSGDIFGVASTGANWFAVKWSPVPEPGSLSLVIGSVPLLLRRWARKRTVRLLDAIRCREH